MIGEAYSSKLRSLTANLFLGLLFFLVFLPSGTFFGVNVKVIAVSLFLTVFVVYLFASDGVFGFSDLIFLSAVILFLGLWAFLGTLDGGMEVAQVFYELRDIASTIFIAWLGIFLIRKGIVEAEKLISVIIWAVFALAAMKLIMMTVQFTADKDILEIIRSTFGENSVLTGDIAFGLFRLEFSADILGPFALFALLSPTVSGTRFSRLLSYMICGVVLASGFLAFSRYIWLLYAAAFAAVTAIRRIWKGPLLVAVLIAILSVPLYDFFATAFALRFVSDSTAESDFIRVEESQALFDKFKAGPIIGFGLGANAKPLLRSDVLSYSYELQWLAFLMQFGILGMIGIVLLIAAATRDLVMAKHSARLWMALLFALWLGSGFTNPYLTTSFAGGTFALFMAIFYRMRTTGSAGDPPPLFLGVRQG